MRKLKERIHAGETVFGCWLNLGSTVSAEIVGRAGFDWALIDLEHGAGDLTSMYQQLQVLENTGTTALVRTDELSPGKAQRILDAGARGIMFPRLRANEEAEQAVAMMHYPPKGIRGMAKMARATGFGLHAEEYIRETEAVLLTIVQVETVQALANIDAIAATPGVDVLFVGPSDLSLAMGIFGQLDHPDYQRAIRQVAKAAAQHGKTPGVLLQDPREYDTYHPLGYRFLACGADGAFVSAGANNMVKLLNGKKN